MEKEIKVSQHNEYPPIDNIPGEFYASINIRVKAPEGNFYFMFDKDKKGKLVRIGAVAGKTGSQQAAWLDAFCRVISRQLERNYLTVEELKEELSSTRTMHSKVDLSGVEVTSGPEALFIALCRYTDAEFEELSKNLGIKDRVSRLPQKGRAD